MEGWMMTGGERPKQKFGYDPERQYPYFEHRACPDYPCHENADPDNFNCLFCFCPLYALGPDCGGDYEYLPSGVKSCKNCLAPHERNIGNKMVYDKWPKLAALGAMPPAANPAGSSSGESRAEGGAFEGLSSN